MSYEEADKIYCYPNTDILKNKFNIKNEKELEIIDRAYTASRILQLKEDIIKIEGNFDLEYLKNIHKHIFQDIYDWAGELRKVEIYKGIVFARSEFIISEGNRIFNELKKRKLS